MYKFKGKERTTNKNEYILAMDLTIKRPTNISIDRLLWFSVGKDVYTVNRLQANTFSVVLYDRVKFNHLKLLMSAKEVNVKIGLAMLRIIEIIGEDEPHQLDPETIYFITNLLNQIDLINIRNKFLVSALPQRV